jgi:prepilin-type N-terminal cleavage/methylation domain-containing protein
MERQAGFTLIETLIGAAIAVVIVWGLLVFADRLVFWAAAGNERVNAVADADRLVERMSSEAASSWAVWVPATDALGASNADGHEVDFFTEDGAHRVYIWGYNFNPTTGTITRYALDPDNAPSAGDTLGAIDAFSASALSVSELGAYDPLFGGASATDVPFTFAAMPGAIGGNRLVVVQITASGVNRSVLLASADAPTAFTVVVTYTPSPAPIVTATPVPPTMYP